MGRCNGAQNGGYTTRPHLHSYPPKHYTTYTTFRPNLHRTPRPSRLRAKDSFRARPHVPMAAPTHRPRPFWPMCPRAPRHAGTHPLPLLVHARSRARLHTRAPRHAGTPGRPPPPRARRAPYPPVDFTLPFWAGYNRKRGYWRVWITAPTDNDKCRYLSLCVVISQSLG